MVKSIVKVKVNHASSLTGQSKRWQGRPAIVVYLGPVLCPRPLSGDRGPLQLQYRQLFQIIQLERKDDKPKFPGESKI